MNRLYFGDNLHWLPKIADESVELIYLDPPFNSKASYNLLYKTPVGDAANAQVQAFVDSWQWGPAADAAFEQVMASGSQAAGILAALQNAMHKSDLMAYLAMMTARLIEMRRVLKPTGSLYLHCDTSASHYLKIILDSVFGPEAFGNEIIWQRTTPKGLSFTRFPSTHDCLLYYRRSKQATWHPQYIEYTNEYDKRFNLTDEATGKRFQATSLINPSPNRPNLYYEFGGHTKTWRWTKERMLKAQADGLIYFPPSGGVPREKRFVDEQEGVPVTTVWTDIPALNARAQERLGYPTQKPLALLDRIIKASSRPGDVVLDPFCGCGTAVEAAQRLGRRWIGIDITALAIDVVERRLGRAGVRRKVDYVVEGVPIGFEDAQRLFDDDPHQFQLWAVTMVDGQPRERGKKGADKGVDGLIYYRKDARGTVGTAIISVKGGRNIHAHDVRDLAGTMASHAAELGLVVTLHKPTAKMIEAAKEAGSIEIGGKRRSRIQIRTVEELLKGLKADLPPVYDVISAAATALRMGRKDTIRLDPSQIRAQPSFKFPIEGGRSASIAAPLFADLPEPEVPVRRSKKRA